MHCSFEKLVLYECHIFTSNYYFSSLDFYNSEPSNFMPFLHTWSLGIEEQFYIIFPIVCFFIYKYLRRHIFLVFLSISTVSLIINIGAGPLKFYLIQYLLFLNQALFHFKFQTLIYHQYLKSSLYISFLLLGF